MSYLKHKPGSIEELMANEASKLNDNAYQDMFKKELDKAGKGIGSMTPAEKKAFFNKIDDKYKAKNEDIKEEVSQKDVDKFHTKLDKLVHKSFGHSSDEKKKEVKEARWEIEGRVNYKGVGPEDGFHMVIDAPTESAAEDKAFDELVKARKQRKIGPGGGGGIDEMEIEYIQKTNDRLQPVTQQRLGNSYDPTQKEEV